MELQDGKIIGTIATAYIAVVSGSPCVVPSEDIWVSSLMKSDVSWRYVLIITFGEPGANMADVVILKACVASPGWHIEPVQYEGVLHLIEVELEHLRFGWEIVLSNKLYYVYIFIIRYCELY